MGALGGQEAMGRQRRNRYIAFSGSRGAKRSADSGLSQISVCNLSAGRGRSGFCVPGTCGSLRCLVWMFVGLVCQKGGVEERRSWWVVEEGKRMEGRKKNDHAIINEDTEPFLWAQALAKMPSIFVCTSDYPVLASHLWGAQHTR